jgi:hypothetical protein
VLAVCYIRIECEQAEFFHLTIEGRERPDSTDYWDANWLVCTAEVAAGAFRGRLNSRLRTDELEQFYQQVELLYERLSGEAELTTMEGWLAFRLLGEGLGHVEATCRLRDDPASGNTLECHLTMDQTFLPPLLLQLATVLKTYPVLHRQD